MRLDGNERAKLISLLLNDPLSSSTVQHGRMLTGTALFVMAAKKGIEVAGTGGVNGTPKVPTANVNQFMRLVLVALLCRFAIGVAAGLVQLKLRWDVTRSEAYAAPDSASSPFAAERKEQLKYLLGRKLSGLSFFMNIAMYALMLAADGLVPVLAATLALLNT
jgi:hypothetical protein